MVAHSKVNPNFLPELIRRCHEADIEVDSWVAFNLEVIKPEDFYPAKRWPQWTMKFIEDPEGPSGNSIGMCTLSSPYTEKLAEFYQEIVSLGFDGVLIDTYGAHGSPVLKVGCVCDYCHEGFKKDTGLDLPAKVDLNDIVFKRSL